VLCRADHVLSQITGRTLPADGLMPVLACGARNPGYTFIAASRDVERSVIAEFIRESEELASDAGLKAVSYLYVHHADTTLERELAEAGYVSFPGEASYSLDVPPSFDDYLNSFPSHGRLKIRRDIRQLAEAGVAYRVEPLTPDLVARLAPLEAQLFARYGTPGNKETLGAMMTSMAENLADNAEAVLAELDGEICGFAVLLSGKNELYGRHTGYDYRMKGRLPVYFGVGYYEVIRLAQHRGIDTIYFGAGTGKAKLSRGCRPSPARAWVKSLDTAAHDRLARLMVA
jgi:predicted N-acyltransferase